jgi:hypothetical protein
MVGESVFFDWRHAQMQTSSEYLTLALDVRKVTDSLIRLVEQGTPSDDLNSSITQVVKSLQSTGKTTVKSLRERGPFGRYVSVRAISEVFPDEKRKKFVGTLQQLQQMLFDPHSPEQRTESALSAIPYFDEWERRALYHHSRALMAKRYAPAR